MKKHKLVLLAAMAILISFAACQKNNDFSTNPQRNAQKVKATVFQGEESGKGSQPDPLTILINSLYGDSYDISQLAQGVFQSQNNQSVSIRVYHNLYLSYCYLTVIYSTGSQILGIYGLSYLQSKANEGNSSIYSFSIHDPEYLSDEYFTGYVNTSAHYTDYLHVNQAPFYIPTDYPYPIFDNLAGGSVDLEHATKIGIGNLTTIEQLTLDIAATFYANYCD